MLKATLLVEERLWGDWKTPSGKVGRSIFVLATFCARVFGDGASNSLVLVPLSHIGRMSGEVDLVMLPIGVWDRKDGATSPTIFPSLEGGFHFCYQWRDGWI